jgi:hypothetical protein
VNARRYNIHCDPQFRTGHLSEASSSDVIRCGDAIAAFAIILGLFFFTPSNDRTTTAANDAPVSRQVNPSMQTPTPVPAPPAKTQ